MQGTSGFVTKSSSTVLPNVKNIRDICRGHGHSVQWHPSNHFSQVCYISLRKKLLFPTRKHLFERDKEDSQQHLNHCTWFQICLPNFTSPMAVSMHMDSWTCFDLLYKFERCWWAGLESCNLCSFRYMDWSDNFENPISHVVPKEVAEFTSLIFIPCWRARCWMKGQSKKSPLYVTKMFGFTSCICENQVTKSSFCKEK